MPTFEDLPAELRQEIFKHTFTDVIETDLKFNSYIESCIRSYSGISRLETQPPKQLLRCLGPAPTRHDEWHPDFFAPHICHIFEVLSVAFVDNVDDLRFTFGKALDCFEEEAITLKEKERRRAGKAWDLPLQSAIGYYCDNFGGCGDLHDSGDGIETDAIFLEKFNVSGMMVKRFNVIIARDYPDRGDW